MLVLLVSISSNLVCWGLISSHASVLPALLSVAFFLCLQLWKVCSASLNPFSFITLLHVMKFIHYIHYIETHVDSPTPPSSPILRLVGQWALNTTIKLLPNVRIRIEEKDLGEEMWKRCLNE